MDTPVCGQLSVPPSLPSTPDTCATTVCSISSESSLKQLRPLAESNPGTLADIRTCSARILSTICMARKRIRSDCRDWSDPVRSHSDWPASAAPAASWNSANSGAIEKTRSLLQTFPPRTRSLNYHRSSLTARTTEAAEKQICSFKKNQIRVHVDQQPILPVELCQERREFSVAVVCALSLPES